MKNALGLDCNTTKIKKNKTVQPKVQLHIFRKNIVLTTLTGMLNMPHIIFKGISIPVIIVMHPVEDVK